MGLRGKRPQSGPEGVTYLHDKCRDPGLRKGWLAGDVHVLEMHVGRGKSRPCEQLLLGAGTHCPGCAENRPVEEIGWVPLRREDGRPVCVLIRKATIPFVAQMEKGGAVYWGRAEGRFEGIGITPRPERVKWENYFTGMPNDDMGYWIPLYLQTPHLAAAMRQLWRAGECQPVVTPAEPLPAPVVVSVLPAPAPAQSPDREQLVGEEYNRVVEAITRKTRRMRDPERNGQH